MMAFGRMLSCNSAAGAGSGSTMSRPPETTPPLSSAEQRNRLVLPMKLATKGVAGCRITVGALVPCENANITLAWVVGSMIHQAVVSCRHPSQPSSIARDQNYAPARKPTQYGSSALPSAVQAKCRQPRSRESSAHELTFKILDDLRSSCQQHDRFAVEPPRIQWRLTCLSASSSLGAA